MNSPKTARLAVVAAALFLVAACSQPSDQGGAELALCDSLAAFDASVQAIADLDPQASSVEDAQAAADAAQTAWDQVKTDAAAVSSADDAALESAWNDLAQTIGDLPSDAPIADNWDTVQSGIDNVQSVFVEMHDGLGCPSVR
jgi:hypothetical protein